MHRIFTKSVASVYPTYVTRYYPPGGDTTATTFRRGTIFERLYRDHLRYGMAGAAGNVRPSAPSFASMSWLMAVKMG